MSISAQSVIKVIEARLTSGTDTTLTDINGTISRLGLNAQDALDIAVQVANIQLAKGMKEDDIVGNLISAYKAAAYQLLQKNNVAFQNDPGLHGRLNEFFQRVRALIKESQQVNNSASMSQLAGTGIAPASVALSPSAIPAGAAPIEGFAGATVTANGGVAVPASARTEALSSIGQSLDSFTTPAAPAAAVATAEIKKQEAAQAEEESKRNNAPIGQITEVDHLESYAEHELKTPKERITITAKEANERVTEFLETGNWAESLEAMLKSGGRTVYYKGADIVVRRHINTRAYLLNLEGDKAAIGNIDQFLNNHDSLLSNLDGLTGNNDPEQIIKTVTDTVNGMKKNIVSLYGKLMKDEVGTATVSAEVSRFTNALLGMMSVAIHNAISLATNRCKDIPLNPKITLERTMDDLDFFSGWLYEKTTGENGYSTEPDFFRELFLVVAASLRKVTVRRDEGEVLLVLTNIEIAIPGNYPTLKRNNVIGKHSLGATQDPVSTIFELCGELAPTANVYLKADENYLLLSNGEMTAPIYY